MKQTLRDRIDYIKFETELYSQHWGVAEKVMFPLWCLFVMVFGY